MRSALLSAAAFAALLALGSAHAQQAQLADPQQQQTGQKATETPSGKAGKEEPASHVLTDRPIDMEPLANGRWNVPGAPADSQTVPAKFSERDAWVDSLPIMASALIWLDDAGRKQIADAVRAENAPAAAIAAKPAEVISGDVALRDLPALVKTALPGLDGYQYVRTADSVLIVREPTSIVVGAIPLAPGTTGSGAK